MWTPYDQHRLGPNVVPEDIYTRADLWNAPSPLILFERVEWCPTDRVMRQFGLAQTIPGVPRSLAKKHNECLTGPKCKNWRNEHRDLIGEWLNRVPVWVPGYEPPAGVPVVEYITWHNREYKDFVHLSAFEEEQGQHEDEDEPEEQPEQPEQPQQECYVPHRSPTPIEIPPQENNQETVFPPHGSTPQPPSFPESSGRQLSSYPQLMYSMAPYLAERMDPQVFNAVYSSVNDFDMGQHNQTMPGRLSVDSHFHASAASANSAARQSFDSSRSLNVRGIGDDGVRRANTAAGIDLNFNASSIQEDKEAARYMRYRDTNRLNTDDGDEDEDEDEDEEEDYLLIDGGDVDTEASNCAGDASGSAAAASTPKLAGKGYDLRTEHSRRSPKKFTPSGWSTKALKQGASGVVKNVSNLFGKKK
ncbi:hypothetical protein PIB30_015635 [Stylosanthes scabra]|uniref:Aminotransferase-like plant mobile domain-containing protein n=1 Tax=Stylosanthes scabra TaxID=79078 RepID=A0ABU6S6Y5_9FABA|nr:hypothetical protein [Stylosanthes scabra]